MKIEFDWPDNVPVSEFSKTFIQAMLDRMATAFSRYGKLSDAYPDRVNALETHKHILRKYLYTGNLEYLVNAANYLMIEFMHPRDKGAFWDKTSNSDGRIWVGEKDAVRDNNKLNQSER